MHFEVHQVKIPQLQNPVQYILYNQNHSDHPVTLTSYPNTNICVGLIKGYRLVNNHGVYEPEPYDGIFAYVNGLHDQPHRFTMASRWDEICIDFNPSSYLDFFTMPGYPQIMETHLFEQLFSPKEQKQWELIFEGSDLQGRSQQIESLLFQRYHPVEIPLLRQTIHKIEYYRGQVTVKRLLQETHASERRLYQVFADHFAIRPKTYIRMYKLRQALQSMIRTPESRLSDIAYASGYADQSHLIKDSQALFQVSPKQWRQLSLIQDQVFLG